MKIPRIYQNLDTYLKPGKALIIYGPRQVGKTTLVKDFINTSNYKYRYDSGENILVKEVLSSANFNLLADYVRGYELIVIDEAQKVPCIGSALKILVDTFPDLKIIATGSSSFELAGQVGEPLTGRKNTISLFPISQIELSNYQNPFELNGNLEDYLIYGSYPEVIATPDKAGKVEILNELTGSYLLKDVFEFERIRNSQTVFNLLRLLAFQLGNEVSFTELSKHLGIDNKTVARYIDLLEKAFVIIGLGGYSRNLRNEIVKKKKYYFYDVGLRNALIANFNSLSMRNDIGQIWENFLLVERFKKQAYRKIYCNNYFWRTWDQKEIDFIEEKEGKLFAFEFKWGRLNVKAPAMFMNTYPEAIFEVVSRENYIDFVL